MRSEKAKRTVLVRSKYVPAEAEYYILKTMSLLFILCFASLQSHGTLSEITYELKKDTNTANR